MKIYDISQEVFSCEVYPGDESPKKTEAELIGKGGTCNLTNFSMCAHNGTHIDAPFHFIDGAKTVDRLSLEKLIGYCCVVEYKSTLSARDAEEILFRAAQLGEEYKKKILIKGGGDISEDAGNVLVKNGVELIGVEVQSVAEEIVTQKVHTLLLERETVLLEGIRLGSVSEGGYFLFAAPINLGNSDGAPCRAVLISE